MALTKNLVPARPSPLTKSKKRCRRSAASNKKSRDRLQGMKAARKSKFQVLEGGYCTQGS